MHRTTGTPALRRWLVGGASLVLAATMVGCSSDDDAGDTSSGATSAAANEADPAAFCDAAVDLEAGLATAEADEQVESLLTEAVDTAPDEVSDHISALTGQVRQGFETGDESVFESPEFLEANAGIDEYMLAKCGYEQIEATGVEYGYEGIPDTLGAGVVAITFTNQGDELHEITIARITDGITMPVEELLALESDAQLTYTGQASAAPNESDTTFLRLESGRYGAICFLPQGTTHDTEGTGPPHYTLGMAAEFTVE